MLIRQTNIIWIAFITMEHLFDLLDHKMHKPISHEQYTSIMYLRVSKLLLKYLFEVEYFAYLKFTLNVLFSCYGKK